MGWAESYTRAGGPDTPVATLESSLQKILDEQSMLGAGSDPRVHSCRGQGTGSPEQGLPNLDSNVDFSLLFHLWSSRARTIGSNSLGSLFQGCLYPPQIQGPRLSTWFFPGLPRCYVCLLDLPWLTFYLGLCCSSIGFFGV